MKCPYCFRINRLGVEKKKGSRIVYYCSYCKSEIPRIYYETPKIPYLKIGIIGYSGHGKTTYITSLLNKIKYLPEVWNDFSIETLDDDSHNALYRRTSELEHGRFPQETPPVFPKPTFFRLNNMPNIDSTFAGFFDTGGKLFENLNLMTKKGRFFTQSAVIFFIVSLSEQDIKDIWNLKIMKLLDRYINVVYSRYGTKTNKKQNIVFILTKADKLLKDNAEQQLPEDITNFLQRDIVDQNLQMEDSYFENLKKNSTRIETWLRSNNCNSFINYSKDHFKTVSFMMVSSLGNNYMEQRPTEDISLNDAKCVIDPFLWALHLTN